MEIIAKVSKGSKMDQIYIPKTRTGLEVGSYVQISPISDRIEIRNIGTSRPYFYGFRSIEPIKLELINKIFILIGRIASDIKNIIITGSFLEKGFKFNDIDILIITGEKVNEIAIREKIDNIIGLEAHIIVLSQETLQEGLSTDPLYNLMLSKCIAKKRIIFKIKRRFDYKVLDLHLLKSELLIDNFDNLTEKQKYDLIRNLIAIKLFIENKKMTMDSVNFEIVKVFKLKNIEEIRNNLLSKKEFIKTYKRVYKSIQNEIFNLTKNGSK